MFLSYYASTFHNMYFIIFIDIIKISDLTWSKCFFPEIVDLATSQNTDGKIELCRSL